jgi:hypothetical protein
VDVFGIPVHIVSALLLAAGLLVLISLALVARAVHGDPPPPDLDVLRAAAKERAEHAAAAQVRAGQAAAAAAQYRAWASAAVAARDVAWQMQEDAHAAYQQARQLAAVAHRDVPVPQPDRTVSRAALSAYRRGDISVDELHGVWARGEGLDELV